MAVHLTYIGKHMALSWQRNCLLCHFTP